MFKSMQSSKDLSGPDASRRESHPEFLPWDSADGIEELIMGKLGGHLQKLLRTWGVFGKVRA